MFGKKHQPQKHQPLLLKQSGYWCITTPILLGFKNSDQVTLKNIACIEGFYDVRNNDDKNLTRRLCRYDEDVSKTTFIWYIRNDGKVQETRLDKLSQVMR